MSTKIIYGRVVFDDCAPVRSYLKMLNERPTFRKTNDNRKVATEAMVAARTKKG